MKKKGFTLIELIAVLVIMSILALIVTPLVMTIIRKARVSADKRSIDAYGRSIELAIASYLLDTGKFPTSIDQLTIEYSGSAVECETTQLNSDSSVYLTGCTVAGRTVDYAYGSDKSPSYDSYSVGDEVAYNGVDYRVIKNSGVKESTVTLLKAEPLSVSDVNTYGAGHVNMYNCIERDDCYHAAYNVNGYGGMAYYTSVNCGFGPGSNQTDSGCTTNYVDSEIKYVVDAWKIDKAPSASEARLITYTELTDLGFIAVYWDWDKNHEYPYEQLKYDWLYNGAYWYWTMSPYQDSTYYVWHVRYDGGINYTTEFGNCFDGGAVRPIIVLPKSELSN